MSFDDLAGLTREQIDRALEPLRRAHARIERILRDGKGTEFDAFAALEKRGALEREIQRLEHELTDRLGTGVGAVAEGAVAVADERFASDDPAAAPLRVDANVVARAQRDAAQQVVGIGQAMRTDLNNAVVDALTGGHDRVGFEQAIRDAMGPDVTEARVERIARTELSKAYMGQQAANDQVLAQQPGVDLIKRWVRSGKGPGRSRPEHDAIHGQERELTDDFDLAGGATAATPPGGGEFQCAGPLDPRLPAAQAIGCGCDVVYVPREEARQAYIARAEPLPTTSESAAAPV